MERISTIAKRLKEYRDQNNLTLADMSQRTGVPAQTLNRYELGQRVPKLDAAVKIADAINVNPLWLQGYDVRENISEMDSIQLKDRPLTVDYIETETSSLMGHIDAGKSKIIRLPDEADEIAERYRNLDDHGKGAVRAILDFEEASLVAERRQNQKKAKPVKPRSDGFVYIDVFDQPAAAGFGNYLSDPVCHKERYPANKVPEGTGFGVRISGVSMAPTIPDGATAFVQSRSAIEPGKIGIFLLNGESFCKKLVVDRERQEVRLVSFNPDYKDRIIEDADVFSTIGEVLGWWPHG